MPRGGTTNDQIPGFEDIQREEKKADKEETPPFQFETLEGFVTEVLLPLYPQVWGAGKRWCAYWRMHEPAVARLEAVWKHWEHIRHEPASISAWMRDHSDYHMAYLMAEGGPFDGCSIGTIEAPAFVHSPRVMRFPSDPAPDGLFPKYPTA